MKNIQIKYISILTVIILFCYVAAAVVTVPFFVPSAKAAAIENEDIYKGIGIAVILYFLARTAQQNEEEETEAEEVVDDFTDYEQKDVDLLARAIYAEARGEPYDGQVAVGAVILNRVDHPDFPETLSGVIYQEGQFTSVKNGQINLTPGVTAYNAAYDALDGIDPSLNALYFYNPEKAKTLWWLSTREKTAIIGDHVFAK